LKKCLEKIKTPLSMVTRKHFKLIGKFDSQIPSEARYFLRI